MINKKNLFFFATKKGFICLLYLCTQKDETRLVSSVGLEYDATNVGVGSSNLSRVTSMLYGVTVSTSDSESGSGGSNPSGATTLGTLADLVYAED